MIGLLLAFQIVSPPAPPAPPAWTIVRTIATCDFRLEATKPQEPGLPKNLGVRFFELRHDAKGVAYMAPIGVRVVTPSSDGIYRRIARNVPRGVHAYLAEWSGDLYHKVLPLIALPCEATLAEAAAMRVWPEKK